MLRWSGEMQRRLTQLVLARLQAKGLAEPMPGAGPGPLSSGSPASPLQLPHDAWLAAGLASPQSAGIADQWREPLARRSSFRVIVLVPCHSPRRRRGSVRSMYACSVLYYKDIYLPFIQSQRSCFGICSAYSAMMRSRPRNICVCVEDPLELQT